MENHDRFRPEWISDNNAHVRRVVRTLINTLVLLGLTIPVPVDMHANGTQFALGQDFFR